MAGFVLRLSNGTPNVQHREEKGVAFAEVRTMFHFTCRRRVIFGLGVDCALLARD